MWEYGSSFMYNNTYYKITKEHKKLLKTLKGKLVNSGYAEKILIFDSNDNPHIELETFKNLSVTVNFFFLFAFNFHSYPFLFIFFIFLFFIYLVFKLGVCLDNDFISYRSLKPPLTHIFSS